MMNLNIKRESVHISTYIFLCMFGLIFTGAGLFALSSNNIDPNWRKVLGEVVESSSTTNRGSTLYSPVVQYEVGGKTYKVASSISTSSYPDIGQKREVAYNPERHEQSKVVETVGSQWFLYIFPLIGITCILFVLYQIFHDLKRRTTIKKLLQNGQKIQGVLVDVLSDGGSNKGSYKVVVTATDQNGLVQNYTSDTLTNIGGLAMIDFRTNPVPIDVYIDPKNSKNYYVDITDIPNLTPERIEELLKKVQQGQ